MGIHSGLKKEFFFIYFLSEPRAIIQFYDLFLARKSEVASVTSLLYYISYDPFRPSSFCGIFRWGQKTLRSIVLAHFIDFSLHVSLIYILGGRGRQ